VNPEATMQFLQQKLGKIVNTHGAYFLSKSGRHCVKYAALRASRQLTGGTIFCFEAGRNHNCLYVIPHSARCVSFVVPQYEELHLPGFSQMLIIDCFPKSRGATANATTWRIQK
jgi:hypothetical protein